MKLFFELLLVSTGAKASLTQTYTDKQWEEALKTAQQQTITGVLTTALERLPKEQLPSKLLLLTWLGLSEIVADNSKKITDASRKVVSYFHENGFACQILKGCAVARYYPVPERRTSGDVDVWVEGGREKIYDFARRFDKDGKLYGVNYQHIHFHLIEGVHIEVHIWPSYLSSPLRNLRLHRFFGRHAPTMDTDMPSLSFDRVFILLHCYQHLCGHGVGLRQLMDYYYVLKQGFSEEERKESARWIEQLGMKRFAQGVMWIFQRFLGMEDRYLLLPPNEKEGRFIMKEVLQTGNMGHSDTRNWGSLKTPLSRFFYNLRRDAWLVRHCPHEVLWQPFFSLWLYFWRLSKGLLNDGDKD